MMIDFQQGTAQPPIPVMPGEPGAATSAAAGQEIGATAGQTPSAATSTSQDGLTTTIPITSEAMCTLRDQRSELSDQLISAQGRRDDIAEELAGLGGAGVGTALRTGLEQRLAQLDGRILRIEEDIAENGRLLAAAPPSLLSNSEVGVASGRPFDLSAGQITGISIVSVLFVGMPLAIGAAVSMWRRSNRPSVPALPVATQQRLERMEQAIDTIAIEMERVSENQRFITRLLAEGPAQPIAIDARAGDAVRSARDE